MNAKTTIFYVTIENVAITNVTAIIKKKWIKYE